MRCRVIRARIVVDLPYFSIMGMGLFPLITCLMGNAKITVIGKVVEPNLSCQNMDAAGASFQTYHGTSHHVG